MTDSRRGSAPDQTQANAEQTASQLRAALRTLAGTIVLFPSFLGPGSLQAVEVTPLEAAGPDRGCVVVCPDGTLHELVVRMLPGPIDVGGVEQVEELNELDLPSTEYVAYARAAIAELERIVNDKAR